MPVTINGNGSITGLSVGGLPNGTVDADTLATNSVTDVKISGMAASKLTGALPAISGASLTGITAAAGSVYDTFHGQGFNVSSASNGYITSGWGKPGGPGGSWANGPSGGRITESSGIFSFPSTGIYYISYRLGASVQNANNRIVGNRIYATNSNANPPAHQVAHGEYNIKSFSGIDNGYAYGTAHCECILKVTNTTNDKVAMWWQSEDAANFTAGFSNMVIFFKLADI